MPTPKKRMTRSKRNMRRAHDFLKAPTVRQCPNCGSLMKPHHVCLSCGYYRGRSVVVAQA